MFYLDLKKNDSASPQVLVVPIGFSGFVTTLTYDNAHYTVTITVICSPIKSVDLKPKLDSSSTVDKCTYAFVIYLQVQSVGLRAPL